MKIYRYILSVFLLLVILSGCRKDSLVIDETPNITTPSTVIKYEVAITGEVFDKIGEPIVGASIFLGEDFAVGTTDQNGFFKVTGLVNETKAVLTVSKDNYFSNYPTFYPERGTGQHLRIELMDREIAGIVNPTSNDLKIVQYGLHQIDFTGATFKNLDGSNYSSDVSVYMTYLDPTRNDLNEFMPGDLVGINIENQEQLLKSYGMLNVELTDGAGNEVVMEGTAKLTMELPNSLLGNSPATIPLWYFDTETGNWKEEGTATREGNKYVGTVTHFTLWNCDVSFDLVTINGTVNTELDPTTLVVQVFRPNGDNQSTRVNADHGFEGKVPANEELVVRVTDLCDNLIYEETIGSFSTDQTLSPIDISATPDLNIVNVSGIVVGCDGDAVTNGYAIVSGGTSPLIYAETNSNGEFSINLPLCEDDFVYVIGFNSDTETTSLPFTFDFNEQIIVGTITACEDMTPGLYINGPDINLFIPSTGNWIVTEPLNDNEERFDMELRHEQSNGAIVYQSILTFKTLTFPDFPEFDPFSLQIFGFIEDSPAQKINIILTESVRVNTIYNTGSGDLISLQYVGVSIFDQQTDGSSGTVYPDHSIRLVGFAE